MHEMPMTELLGVFPSLEPLGGVQASGREAWQGIVNQIGENRACFFGYRAGGSKTRAALSALAQRRRATFAGVAPALAEAGAAGGGHRGARGRVPARHRGLARAGFAHPLGAWPK
jgi:hypothetical protein